MELFVISTLLYLMWDDLQMQLKYWQAFPFSINLLSKRFMSRGVIFKQNEQRWKFQQEPYMKKRVLDLSHGNITVLLR